MKFTLFSILFITICFFQSYSLNIDEKINNIGKLDTSYYQKKVYLVTNLDNCIGCNISQINTALKFLSDNIAQVSINMVFESKYSKDSYYLKSQLKNCNFFEINDNFVTTDFDIPLVLIYKNNDNLSYYKISKFDEIRNRNFLKYINNEGELLKTDFVIQERNKYLSKIKVISDDDNLLIFDYSNKELNIYNDAGNISKSIAICDTFMIYIGNSKDVEDVHKEGITFNYDILKVEKNHDTLYLLQDRVLYDIRRTDDNKFGIRLRPVLSKFHNNQILSNEILDINAYENLFLANNRIFFEFFIFPDTFSDSSYFIREYNKSSSHYLNINLSKINSKFDLSLSKLSDITFKDIDISGYFFFICKNNSNFYILGEEQYYTLPFQGIVKFKEDVVFQDWKIINNNLFLIFNDKNKLYCQKYELKTAKLVDEIISRFENDELIQSKFLKIIDTKIEFINRWKNKRWVKQSIDFN